MSLLRLMPAIQKSVLLAEGTPEVPRISDRSLRRITKLPPSEQHLALPYICVQA